VQRLSVRARTPENFRICRSCSNLWFNAVKTVWQH